MVKKILKSLLAIIILSSNVWSADIRIGSFNIRNFKASFSLEKANFDDDTIRTNLSILKGLLSSTKADLLAVQEINQTEEFKAFIKAEFPDYEVVLSKCGGLGEQHLGFIYNSKKLKLEDHDEDLRLIIDGDCYSSVRPAMIGYFYNKIDRSRFVAMALHLKAGGSQRSVIRRQKQHEVISRIVEELRTMGHHDIMMMGDLNTTNFLSGNDAARKFNRFVDKNRFKNFSEKLECTSYWQGQNRQDNVLEKSLLDHVMVSEEIANRLTYSDVEVHSHCKRVACGDAVETDELGRTYVEVSDHCPVVATLRTSK